MPTLPLFTPATDPNAPRQVRAPGGYESRYFMAMSSDPLVQVMAGFHHGYPLDRNYARLYLLYRALPTRLPPPEPMHHESMTLMVVRDGAVVKRVFEMVHPHGAPHVVDGKDGLARVTIGDADLTFRPRPFAACEPIDDGPHHVIVTAPMCEVTGTIGSSSFAGFGASDHRFGTRWPRETGGVRSGGSFNREQAMLFYAFGERAHLLEVTAGACTHLIVDHHKPPQTMLCETIPPSRFASRLNRAGDR